MSPKKEAMEVICPKCRHTEIIYLQNENMPLCPKCDLPTVIRELLVEGKYT